MTTPQNQDPSLQTAQIDTLRTLHDGVSIQFADGMEGTIVEEPGASVELNVLAANPVTLSTPAIVITEQGHYATNESVLTTLPLLDKPTGQFGTDTDRLLAARYDSGKIGGPERITVGLPWENITRLTRGADSSPVTQLLFGPGAKMLETTTTAPNPKRTNLPSPFESAKRHVERVEKKLPRKLGEVATY